LLAPVYTIVSILSFKKVNNEKLFYKIKNSFPMARNGIQHGCQACAFWLKIKIQNGDFLYNLNGNNVKLVFFITYGWEIQNMHA
jgi:hypothetical protein